MAGIQAGARVDTDKYDKENARDFVLWKFKSDEPEWAQWEAPFGKGRPGWHIECSAMSMKYLGETFDLHAGGEDLIFPHHENEIAQSTCGTGKPFARHWMHVKHLLIDNETMSKSKGNFFTIPDLVEKGHSPEAIRYLLAGSHYRKPLNFGFEGLAAGEGRAGAASTASSARLDEVGGEGPEGRRPAAEACAEARRAFDAALADDLNTPEALAAVHGLVGRANALLAEGALTRAGAARVRAELAAMDAVFGVLLPGGGGGPPLAGGAGALRRAAGGAAAAGVRPRGRARGRAWRRSASCSRTPRRARAGGGSGEPVRLGRARRAPPRGRRARTWPASTCAAAA